MWADDSHNAQGRSYGRGTSALDSRQYERALDAFSQAASATGGRADGALYWKAYSLLRLGRRDEALSALAELRKAYATSRWLPDSQALEAEMQRVTGQRTAAEWDAEEEMKMTALSGLLRTDAERALPFIEQTLKGSAYRRLQHQALHLLATSELPRSRELLADAARGTLGNPDLQIHAIRALGTSSTAANAKALVDLARNVKDPQLRREIVARLSHMRSKEAVDYLMELLK